MYWILGVGSTICLYNTFFLTSIILISTGYCFARDTFERNEVNYMAISMGGVYLIYSIFLLEMRYSRIILLIMVGVI